jgi:hypothetical protein
MPNSADRDSDDDHGNRSWHQGAGASTTWDGNRRAEWTRIATRAVSRCACRARAPNPFIAKCFGFPSSAWARQTYLLSERTLERASDGAPGPAIRAADFTGQRVGDRSGAAVHVFSSLSFPVLDRKVLRRSSSVRKASRLPRELMTIAFCVPWDGFLFGRRSVYPTRSRVLPSRWDHVNQMGVERQWRLASTDGVRHPDEIVESLDPAGIIVRIAPSLQGRQIREGGHRGGGKRLTNSIPDLTH